MERKKEGAEERKRKGAGECTVGKNTACNLGDTTVRGPSEPTNSRATVETPLCCTVSSSCFIFTDDQRMVWAVTAACPTRFFAMQCASDLPPFSCRASASTKRRAKCGEGSGQLATMRTTAGDDSDPLFLSSRTSRLSSRDSFASPATRARPACSDCRQTPGQSEQPVPTQRKHPPILERRVACVQSRRLHKLASRCCGVLSTSSVCRRILRSLSAASPLMFRRAVCSALGRSASFAALSVASFVCPPHSLSFISLASQASRSHTASRPRPFPYEHEFPLGGATAHSAFHSSRCAASSIPSSVRLGLGRQCLFSDTSDDAHAGLFARG